MIIQCLVVTHLLPSCDAFLCFLLYRRRLRIFFRYFFCCLECPPHRKCHFIPSLFIAGSLLPPILFPGCYHVLDILIS